MLPCIISPELLPLQFICATRVAQHLLESSGRLWDRSKDGKTRATEARSRVKKLKLPKVVLEKVERLIEPVNREIIALTRMKSASIRVPVNPHGCITTFHSSEDVMMDENVSVFDRFVIASDYSHEKYVFKLAKQLSVQEISVVKSSHPNSLSSFWLKAYEKQRAYEPSGDVVLGYAMCIEGYNLACKKSCNLTKAYFIDKAHPKALIEDPGGTALLYHKNPMEGLYLNKPVASETYYDVLLANFFFDDFIRGKLSEQEEQCAHISCHDFWLKFTFDVGQTSYFSRPVFMAWKDTCTLTRQIIQMIYTFADAIENQQFDDFKRFLKNSVNGVVISFQVAFLYRYAYMFPEKKTSIWNYTAYCKERKNMKVCRKFRKIIEDVTLKK